MSCYPLLSGVPPGGFPHPRCSLRNTALVLPDVRGGRGTASLRGGCSLTAARITGWRWACSRLRDRTGAHDVIYKHLRKCPDCTLSQRRGCGAAVPHYRGTGRNTTRTCTRNLIEKEYLFSPHLFPSRKPHTPGSGPRQLPSSSGSARRPCRTGILRPRPYSRCWHRR